MILKLCFLLFAPVWWDRDTADPPAVGTVTRGCCSAPAPLTRASPNLLCKTRPAWSTCPESGRCSLPGELCRSEGTSLRVGTESGPQSRQELGWKMWPVLLSSAKPAALFGERGVRRQRVGCVRDPLAPRPSACSSPLRSCRRDSF